MKRTKSFPFEKARRISEDEVERYRDAIGKKTGQKRPKRVGRPPKQDSEKYVPVSIRLHPLALAWLKKQARKRAVPYQTIINQILLRHAG